MRSLLVLLCVLVGCGGNGDGDDCDGGGDAATFDLHTTQQLGDLLDERDGDVTAVALQDGGPACPWHTVAGTGTGHYPLAVHGARYAVAVTCDADLTVLARSRDDDGALAVSCFSADQVEARELRAHTTESATPYVIGTFLATNGGVKAGVSPGAAIGFLWHALDGVYDLVALGHLGDDDVTAPDNVRVVRDLAATTAFDIDVTPMTSSEWVPLGPPVPVTAGVNTIASLRYKTTRGTFVDLGTAIGTVSPQTRSAPTFPAAVRAPGDVYEQAVFVDDFAAGKSFSVTRIAAEPTAFDMPLPPAFDVVVDGKTFTLAPVADATHYELACDVNGRRFTNNLSVAWLGDDATYALPSIPGVSYSAACRWGATAIGATAPSDTWRSSTAARAP